MFADIALAQRIERNTTRLLAESAAASARRRIGANVFAHPIAGGIATYTAPGSPLNKVAGLGFAGVPDDGTLAEIERCYFSRGVAVQLEVATLGDPSIGEMLTRRGYVLMAHENVLGLRLSSVKKESAGAFDVGNSDRARTRVRSDEIRVSLCSDADFQEWLDVVVTGFASPDDQGVQSHDSFGREVMEQVVADMCSAPGFARYVAYRHGERAGGASVYIGHGVAQFCGAATLPPHRRRGVQAALFEARLHDAAAAGCDLATITTMPGSKSQENAQRRGFSLLYSRAILVHELRSEND